MVVPTPFDLAIIFDKEVKPEYQQGIANMIAGSEIKLNCADKAGNPVILLQSADENVVRQVQRTIGASAVGLNTKFHDQSRTGLPFVLSLNHEGQSSIIAMRQQLVVAPATSKDFF